jgi:NTP pyrophosphatase (non-canonical NTP hydrolase)
MNLNEYQRRAQKTAIYNDSISGLLAGADWNLKQTVGMLLRLNYVALGLASEAGEFSGKVKKLLRGDSEGVLLDEIQELLALELGGILWYTSQAAKEVGYTLEDVAQMNLDQLAKRQAAGKLKGEGDNR